MRSQEEIDKIIDQWNHVGGDFRTKEIEPIRDGDVQGQRSYTKQMQEYIPGFRCNSPNPFFRTAKCDKDGISGEYFGNRYWSEYFEWVAYRLSQRPLIDGLRYSYMLTPDIAEMVRIEAGKKYNGERISTYAYKHCMDVMRAYQHDIENGWTPKD